jgi:hypothetical protein
MARIFFDGAESGYGDLYDVGYQAAASGTTPFDGTYRYGISVNGQKSGFDLNEVWGAARVYWASSMIPFYVRVGGTTLAILMRSSTGAIEVRRGSSSGTVIATSTNLLATGNWYLIEWHYKGGHLDGRWEVRVDGNPTLEIDYTGYTCAYTDLNFNTIGFSTGNGYFDNFVLDDAEWVGDTRIQGILPTGAGTTEQWGGTATDNFSCVDERPYSDSDYVRTNSVDQVDLYSFGNLTGSINAIKAVQVQVRAAKEGAPTPTRLRIVVRVGGTNYESSDFTLTTTATGYVYTLPTNPATGLAWTPDDVNGAEFGFKSVA